MTYLILKTILSAIIIVAVSEVARRNPGVGALIAALPLISVLSMIWLWRDTADADRMSQYAQSTFWYVLPSLPMFLLIANLLNHGVAFWPALGAGCLLTVLLYVAMVAALGRMGVKL